MQAQPHPGDIVGSVNLARGAGNANRESRRSTRARPGAVAGRRGHRRGSQISRSDRGGARLGCAASTGTASRPRCLRIRSITAGSSMLAMTRSRPPHRRQVSMSMANTRLRRWAQDIPWCRSMAAASLRHQPADKPAAQAALAETRRASFRYSAKDRPLCANSRHTGGRRVGG